jgi:response regulator RpfG family c-di-GMP phosphodiesterase
MHEDVSELKADVEQRLVAESEQRTMTVQALNDAYALIGESFLNLLDMKQPGQRAFAYQLEEIVQKLAEKWGCSELECQRLKQASRLHGIGKIGVPDATLSKRYAKMTESEKELYKGYPANSACTIIALEAFAECSDLLFKQKECADGTGFPMGYGKEELNHLNLIFNAALSYCELRYSPVVVPLRHDQAIQTLKLTASAFDADVLKALANLDIERDLFKKSAKSVVVHLHSLQPGMIVKEDIFSDRNMLLLREGAIVTESLIDKLSNMQKQMKEKITVSVILPD